MLIQSRITLVLLIFNGFFGFYLFVDGRTIVNKFGNCDPNENYKIQLNITIKTVDNLQYADGTFIIKAPVDNHIKSNVTVEMLIGTHSVYLFSINEKKSCDATNKFLGEFWYDIQSCAQMMPGLCPISAGRYHVHKCLLNFNKLTTVNHFPMGHLRFTVIGYDNKNDIFSCVLAELENRV